MLQQRVTLKAITLMVNELADAAPESAPPPLTQQHELIRDAADYAEFFAAATSGAQPAGEWLQ